jgi:hypothetical protein
MNEASLDVDDIIVLIAGKLKEKKRMDDYMQSKALTIEDIPAMQQLEYGDYVRFIKEFKEVLAVTLQKKEHPRHIHHISDPINALEETMIGLLEGRRAMRRMDGQRCTNGDPPSWMAAKFQEEYDRLERHMASLKITLATQLTL